MNPSLLLAVLLWTPYEPHWVHPDLIHIPDWHLVEIAGGRKVKVDFNREPDDDWFTTIYD